MMRLAGIIWDYDGTIADTYEKNRRVTIELLKNFDKDIADHLPEVLQTTEAFKASQQRYFSWRSQYRDEFGLTDKQIAKAEKLWAFYQMSDTEIPKSLQNCGWLNTFYCSFRMSVCSQNSRDNIIRTLEHYSLQQLFRCVVGYEEVPEQFSKPDPTAIVKCVIGMKRSIHSGVFAYIGNDAIDVELVKRAEEEVGAHIRSIAFLPNDPTAAKEWKLQPDYVAKDTKEILEAIYKIEDRS